MNTIKFTNKLLCKLFGHIWVLNSIDSIRTIEHGFIKREHWSCRRCELTRTQSYGSTGKKTSI